MQRFEEIPHTADWSFRAFGRDEQELFQNAAFALFAMEGAQMPDQSPAGATPRTVEVDGVDLESLFVNWLNELLYLQESNRETYYRFQVETLEPTHLRAQVFARPGIHIDKVIKAATFHNLKLEQVPAGWQAVVVVDV